MGCGISLSAGLKHFAILTKHWAGPGDLDGPESSPKSKGAVAHPVGRYPLTSTRRIDCGGRIVLWPPFNPDFRSCGPISADSHPQGTSASISVRTSARRICFLFISSRRLVITKTWQCGLFRHRQSSLQDCSSLPDHAKRPILFRHFRIEQKMRRSWDVALTEIYQHKRYRQFVLLINPGCVFC